MSRNARVDPVVAAMEKMEKQRQARRNKASKFRRDRKAEEKRNEREGRPGDVDFQRLIKRWRKDHLKDEKEVRRVRCMPSHMHARAAAALHTPAPWEAVASCRAVWAFVDAWSRVSLRFARCCLPACLPTKPPSRFAHARRPMPLAQQHLRLTTCGCRHVTPAARTARANQDPGVRSQAPCERG